MTLKQFGLIAVFAAIPAGVLAQAPQSKGPKQTAPSAGRNEPQAISGLASSGRNCIGPSGANVHSIGWVPSNSRVTVTFSSDFDPVAVTNTQMGSDAPGRVARASYYADDDGGGNLEPELRFTTSFSGTLVLHVSKFSAERNAGCYFYKVEIVTG